MITTKTVRAFIGIEIDQQLREELATEISYLKHHFPLIKWVNPDNIHLTLKFLGNVATDDLGEIFSAAESAALESPAFTLEITGVNAFPDNFHPVVISTGCSNGTHEAIALAQNISKYCATLGYQPEHRPYSPHFTLGRVKKPSDSSGFEDYAVDLINKHFGMLDVDEITIFMSELKKSGARHTPIHRIKLR